MSEAARAVELSDLLLATGGVGLVLIGMSTMSDGLKELGGTAIRDLVSRAGRRPLRGFAVGAGATAAMQTSSSTVLAAMGFAAAGLVTTLEAIPIVAGATVGTTSTTWLVATVGASPSVSAALMPLVLVGALLRMLGTGNARRIGLFLAGIGVIFLGLSVLKGSLGPVVDHLDLDRVDGASVTGRLSLVGLGLVLAIVMQSSAAPVAIAMTAISDGSLSFLQAAPIVVGASVGTTSTAAIAMLAVGAASRQVGLAWIAVAAVAGAIATVGMPLFEHAAIAIADRRGASTTVTLAIFHTLFAGVGAVVALAIRFPLARGVASAFPDRRKTLGLDPALRSVPSAAIEAARRAIAATAVPMVEAARREIAEGLVPSPELVEEAKEAGRTVDSFVRSIDRDSLTADDAEQQVACLQALEHLRGVRKIDDRGSLVAVGRLPELAEVRAEAIAACDEALHWLAAPSGPSPGARLVETATRVASGRGIARARVLGRLARGEIDSLAADVGLDGLRSLDEFLAHLARLVVDLDRSLESPVTNE
jgi:phosphate:Na+ symporter